MPYTDTIAQIESALVGAADRNGLVLETDVSADLARTVADYLVNRGVLGLGGHIERTFPAAITGYHHLIYSELDRLQIDARLNVTPEVLDSLTTVVEGVLVNAGLLAGVGDPGNSPQENLSFLQERIEVDPEPEDKPRLRALFHDAEPTPAVNTDTAYEVVRDVLRGGGQEFGVRLVAQNLNDLTSLVVDFLVERNLLP